MEVEHCYFPDDIYVNPETDTWARPAADDVWRTGVTTTLCFLAGRITKVRPRQGLTRVVEGQSIGTMESVRYFGSIRAPMKGEVKGFNLDVQSSPRVVNDSPYDRGWICEIATKEAPPESLVRAAEAHTRLRDRIRELRVKCFKALPDEEMNSVGLECAATLVNLGELLENKPVGTVVHVVSDDPLGDVEMERWSIQTGQELLETRREGDLYHYIVRKAHG